jgi:hypothetical protein
MTTATKVLIWICIALFITAGIEGYALWSRRGEVDKVMQDAIAKGLVNDSLKAAGIVRDSADNVRLAAVQAHDSITSHRLDSAMHLLTQVKDSLKTSAKTLRNAVTELGTQVASFHDSTLQHQYDSVSSELDRVYLLGGSFVSGSDSAIQLLYGEMEFKDSIIGVLNVEIISLKKSLIACTTNFDGLQRDTNILEKKLKVRAFLEKAGGIAIAILGAIVLIK